MSNTELFYPPRYTTTELLDRLQALDALAHWILNHRVRDPRPAE